MPKRLNCSSFMETSENLNNISNNYNGGEGVNSEHLDDTSNNYKGVSNDVVHCTNTLEEGVSKFSLVMGSGDVVALYPSLLIKVCAYEVG